MAFNTDSTLKINTSDNVSSTISDNVFLYLAENEAALQLLNLHLDLPEGLNLGYYVPRWNKRGWGMMHYRYNVRGKVCRGTTHLKVRRDCWDKGEIGVTDNLNPLERLLHLNVKHCQQRLNSLVISKIIAAERKQEISLGSENNSCQFCNVGNISDIIKSTIKEYFTMMKPKKQGGNKVSVSLLMKQAIEKHVDKETTKGGYKSKVDVLKRFFRDKKIADDVTSINQESIRKFRDYLCETNKASTAKQTLIIITYLLKTIQQDNGKIRFDIDWELIPPIKDKTNRNDRKENGIALTHAEIECIKNADNLKGKQKKYRDLFVIQCQVGCRFEDIPKVLDSRNHIEKEGIVYACFNTEKKGVEAHIPLNATTLYPDTLTLMTPYIDDTEIISLKSSQETIALRTCVNRAIKKIAEDVGLNREITETGTINGKVVRVTKPLYQKISTHDARRSFITNCVREFGLIPRDIIPMSGHSNTSMVENIYTILTSEDKLNAVVNTIGNIGKVKQPIAVNDNRNISDVDEGVDVLKFLGEEVKDTDLTFEEIVTKVKVKERELLDQKGVKPSTLKELFNCCQPLARRKKALVEILKVFN